MAADAAVFVREAVSISLHLDSNIVHPTLITLCYSCHKNIEDMSFYNSRKYILQIQIIFKRSNENLLKEICLYKKNNEIFPPIEMNRQRVNKSDIMICDKERFEVIVHLPMALSAPT